MLGNYGNHNDDDYDQYFYGLPPPNQNYEAGKFEVGFPAPWACRREWELNEEVTIEVKGEVTIEVKGW